MHIIANETKKKQNAREGAVEVQTSVKLRHQRQHQGCRLRQTKKGPGEIEIAEGEMLELMI